MTPSSRAFRSRRKAVRTVCKLHGAVGSQNFLHGPLLPTSRAAKSFFEGAAFASTLQPADVCQVGLQLAPYPRRWQVPEWNNVGRIDMPILLEREPWT